MKLITFLIAIPRWVAKNKRPVIRACLMALTTGICFDVGIYSGGLLTGSLR